MKIGGTSVSSKENWLKILKDAQTKINNQIKPVIVCSAASGVSNLLENSLKDFSKINENLKKIKSIYINLSEDLGVNLKIAEHELSALERYFKGIELTEEVGPRLYAKVMSKGELILTSLVYHFIKNQGHSVEFVDARSLLTSQNQNSLWDHYLDNKCDTTFSKETRNKLLGNQEIVLTQGFIAKDEKDHTVLLGRGGSDTSATIIASKIGASICEIWTDVPGMFTANPKIIPNSKLIKKLDYDEAEETASSGAKVLHPKCIGPLKGSEIPLIIRYTDKPEMEGTVISSKFKEYGGIVKSISIKENVFLISFDNSSMWGKSGFLADIFSVFKKNNLSIDLISTSQTNVTVSLDLPSFELKKEQLNNALEELKEFGKTQLIGPCSTIGIVGNQIRSILYKISSIFKSFEEKKIYLLGQSATDLNLSIVVPQNESRPILEEIHRSVFEQNLSSNIFGNSYKELFNPSFQKERTKWWFDRLEDLNKLDTTVPHYVYHLPTIQNRIEQLKGLKSISKIFYAVKANTHPQILELISKNDLGLECVSIEEMKFIEEKTQNSHILFTPNFCGKEEYEYAFNKNYYVNVDNWELLLKSPEVFQGKKIILRLDPGYGRGHHHYVQTGGKNSKFGIDTEKLNELAKICSRLDVSVIGLHAHMGSGIPNKSTWKELSLFLLSFLNKFPKVKIINLGGGLPIPYRPHEVEFDITELDNELLEIKNLYPDIDFWIEPGRFLVADSGVLLAEVTQIKNKGEVCYIGINSGMNHLIRPALYGSYHHIENISKLNEDKTISANIVGPICESSDILGHNRRFPKTEIRDKILIDTCGAYGIVMSSSYNLRQKPHETFIYKGASRLLFKKSHN